MSIRDRLLGPCAVRNLPTDEVSVDVDAFLRRLLLFDTYIVESFGLKELPVLVRLLGYDGMVELLRTRAIRFQVFGLFAGHLERQGPGLAPNEMRYSLVFDESTTPARPGFYEITNVSIGRPEEEIHNYLQVVHTLPGLSLKKQIRLKNEIAASLIPVPEGFGQQSTTQTHADLDRDLAGLRRAIAQLLSYKFGRRVPSDTILIRVDREGPIACFVESNLTDSFGLDSEEAHRIVGNALLALDRLNVRLELMKLCSAVSGLRGEEFPFLEEKFDFLVREVAPEAQEERIQRVIDIVGLPDFDSAFASGDLNLERFMEVRASVECSQFRSWLRNVDDLSVEELVDRVNSLRARLGNAAHTKTGKVVRVATTTGLGFIPVIGPLLGAGASSLDAFMLDSVLPEAGPVAFLTHLYPSIFEK